MKDFCKDIPKFELEKELNIPNIFISPNQNIILTEYKFGGSSNIIERFSDGDNKYISIFQPLLITSFMEKSFLTTPINVLNFKAMTLFECMIYDIFKIRFHISHLYLTKLKRKEVLFYLYIYYLHYLCNITDIDPSNVFNRENNVRVMINKVIELAESENNIDNESIKNMYEEYKNEANKLKNLWESLGKK